MWVRLRSSNLLADICTVCSCPDCLDLFCAISSERRFKKSPHFLCASNIKSPFADSFWEMAVALDMNCVKHDFFFGSSVAIIFACSMYSVIFLNDFRLVPRCSGIPSGAKAISSRNRFTGNVFLTYTICLDFPLLTSLCLTSTPLTGTFLNWYCSL